MGALVNRNKRASLTNLGVRVENLGPKGTFFGGWMAGGVISVKIIIIPQCYTDLYKVMKCLDRSHFVSI